MPVVDVDTDELRRLTGHEEKSDDEFKEDLFGLGLEFEGETENGDLQFEFAPDRLDRLSVEGVARSLRYQYGDDRGVYVPDTNDAEWTIRVASSVPEERPYVTGAVVRGVDLDEAALDSLIQLQEKLHATMGRKRVKGAIGIHDLAMLKGDRLTEDDDLVVIGDDAGVEGPSITYRGVAPDGDRFVPLDSDAELTPAEVLTEHPTGREYAPVVEAYERYPAIYDELGLFSFPPVINGRRTEVDTDSRELFVEMTGTDQWTIDHMCNIVCYALDARGATIEDVDVVYDADAAGDRAGDRLVRPDFETRRKTVTHDRIESMLGVDLEMETVQDLFERSGLDASAELGEGSGAQSGRESRGDSRGSSEARNASEDASDGRAAAPRDVDYEVEIPPYRVDVLHPVDLVDDVGRAYGFDSLEPRYPEVGTVGGRHERSRLGRAVRTTLAGLGFEDLLNFHMTAPARNYDRMRIDPGSDVLGGGEAVDIESAYSEDYTQLRTWVLPSLMQVLENNTHRAYPQDLSEVGFVAERDDSENTHVAERRHVAGVLARTDASYEDAKARLQALAGDFDVDLETPAAEHPSFIAGRTAEVVVDGESVGVVGEVHPEVLVVHDLEVPVAGFEFRLDILRD